MLFPFTSGWFVLANVTSAYNTAFDVFTVTFVAGQVVLMLWGKTLALDLFLSGSVADSSVKSLIICKLVPSGLIGYQ